jgi:hypothetical protein
MMLIDRKSTMPFSDKKTKRKYFSKNNRVGEVLGRCFRNYIWRRALGGPSQVVF